MMWEWRIFFLEEQKDSIKSYDKIVSSVRSSQIETRFDYYYLINDNSIGLKDRGSVISKSYKPKLELKLLKERSSLGCEYWIKPIREQLSDSFDQNVGLKSEVINKIFLKYREEENQILNSKLDFIIQQLSDTNIERLETKKKRKQKSNPVTINKQLHDLTIELTKLKIRNEKWETIAVEGLSKEAVEFFVRQQFSEKNLRVMGYPQFLIEEFIK